MESKTTSSEPSKLLLNFERTTDLVLIRKILTHPRIWPWITDDGAPDREQFQPTPAGEHVWYVLVWDVAELLGLFIFHPHNSVTWEVHTCLLPKSWGERATRAAVGVQAWLWAQTDWQRIVTTVPANNRLALRFARRAGMVEYGLNPKSWLKDGKLHDQHLLGISRPSDTTKERE